MESSTEYPFFVFQMVAQTDPMNRIRNVEMKQIEWKMENREGSCGWHTAVCRSLAVCSFQVSSGLFLFLSLFLAFSNIHSLFPPSFLPSFLSLSLSLSLKLPNCLLAHCWIRSPRPELQSQLSSSLLSHSCHHYVICFFSALTVMEGRCVKRLRRTLPSDSS